MAAERKQKSCNDFSVNFALGSLPLKALAAPRDDFRTCIRPGLMPLEVVAAPEANFWTFGLDLANFRTVLLLGGNGENAMKAAAQHKLDLAAASDDGDGGNCSSAEQRRNTATARCQW